MHFPGQKSQSSHQSLSGGGGLWTWKYKKLLTQCIPSIISPLLYKWPDRLCLHTSVTRNSSPYGAVLAIFIFHSVTSDWPQLHLQSHTECIQCLCHWTVLHVFLESCHNPSYLPLCRLQILSSFRVKVSATLCTISIPALSVHSGHHLATWVATTSQQPPTPIPAETAYLC